MSPGSSAPTRSLQPWEAIRPIFTRLYVDEDETIAQIIKILGEQGFHASAKQCKYRVKQWNLDKNNKESDMVFAHHKIEERAAEGKDTEFIIRGRRRTSQHIRDYWKRKRTDPADHSVPVHTPAWIRYRTPSPPARGDRLTTRSHDSLNHPSLEYPELVSEMLGRQTQAISRRPRAIPRQLALPGYAQNVEHVMRNMRDYLLLTVDIGADVDLHTRFFQQLNRFSDRIVVAAAYGIACGSPDLLVDNLLKTFHVYDQAQPCFVLLSLLDVAIQFSDNMQKLGRTLWWLLHVYMEKLIKRFQTLDHPLIRVIKAVVDSFNDLSRMLLHLMGSISELLSSEFPHLYYHVAVANAAVPSRTLAPNLGQQAHSSPLWKALAIRRKSSHTLSDDQKRYLVTYHAHLVTAHFRVGSPRVKTWFQKDP